MKAVDCQGLGGGFTLGIKRAGFDIVSKHEQPGGFGFTQVEANRHLLGDFPLDDSAPSDWFVGDEELAAPMLFGCPPCSGFSSMSIRAGGIDRRGTDATINQCMWDLIDYAGKVKPYIIAMESVPAAAKMGLPLMRALHQKLMADTGHGWYLTLLHHNSLSVGGPSQRPRVFMVWSQAPFGITTPNPGRLPVLSDVIGDLEPLELEWEPQARLLAPSWWAERKADTDLVTGHDIASLSRKQARIQGLCEIGWKQGQNLTNACEAYWTATGGAWDKETGQIISEGQFPPGYDEREIERVLYRPARKAADMALVTKGEMTFAEYNEKYGRKIDPTSTPHPFITSMYETQRWDYNKPARVFHGGGMNAAVHPTQPRTFTYREAARFMGFPDSWNLETYVGHENTFGKAVTVDVGFWLGYHLKEHLERFLGGRDTVEGLWTGVENEDGYLERTIDCSRDWQQLEDSKAGERMRAAIEKRGA